ncbi:MAG: hypothetical protein NT031_13060 [Planctomycetota bacterium]|nr:hypothetical protein [Planctomycetota bacterium]
MKVAIFSESPADEAALRVLVDALLGIETEIVYPPVRARGWPSVQEDLPTVVKAVHYRTEAAALLVVADGNHFPMHLGDGQAVCEQHGCRLCSLRRSAVQANVYLSPMAGREVVQMAAGLAVPAIEAWYLCGVNPAVSEQAWRAGMESGQYPYDKKQLKKLVYGTDRPSLAMETQKAVEAAHRLVADLTMLEAKFPLGFGTLATAVRSWRR